MKLLVTGGAGFIGSCFVRMAMLERWAEQVINLDKLTYAGNLDNLDAVAANPGYAFVQGDICDSEALWKQVFGANRPMPSFILPPNRTSTAASTHQHRC